MRNVIVLIGPVCEFKVYRSKKKKEKKEEEEEEEEEVIAVFGRNRNSKTISDT